MLFLAKNACGGKPCENNGTCQAGFTSKGYRYLCPPEFKGEKCTEGKIVIIYFLRSLYKKATFLLSSGLFDVISHSTLSQPEEIFL